MRDFFQGWHRKVGCVTLVLACLTTGLWCRSFATTSDTLTFWDNYSLYSHDGSFSWNVQYTDQPGWTFEALSPATPPTVRSRREFCGLVFSDTSFGGGGVKQYWISDWYLIVPLMLISAWLILVPSLPRHVTKPVSTEKSRA